MILLSRPYAGRAGVPVVDRVEPDIFRLTYFTHCLACTFCDDVCCSYGADVDLPNRDRILAEGAPLEAAVGVGRDDWFNHAVTADPDFDGGAFVRTRVRAGRCVFLDRTNRGCGLHRYALAAGIPVDRIKPMVCSLFPVTFDRGLLMASNEIRERSLVCLGPGETLYRAVRDDLAVYFGAALIAELDRLEAAAGDHSSDRYDSTSAASLGTSLT